MQYLSETYPYGFLQNSFSPFRGFLVKGVCQKEILHENNFKRGYLVNFLLSYFVKPDTYDRRGKILTLCAITQDVGAPSPTTQRPSSHP